MSVRAQHRVPLPHHLLPLTAELSAGPGVSRLFLQLVVDRSILSVCLEVLCAFLHLDTTSELSKSRGCFHTRAPRPESCVCPLPLLGCLSSSPPVGLCFPSQGEVLSSSFGSPHSKYKYDIQSCTGPRLAVTQKVTGHKVFHKHPHQQQQGKVLSFPRKFFHPSLLYSSS